jgi:hypothetical protein
MVTPSKGRTHGPGIIIVLRRVRGINCACISWRNNFHRAPIGHKLQ